MPSRKSTGKPRKPGRYLGGIVESIRSAARLRQGLREGLVGKKRVALGSESAVFARLDHGREARKGFPEVLFGEGKTKEQIAGIAEKLFARSGRLLITRASDEAWEYLAPRIEGLRRNAAARAIWHPGAPALRRRRALAKGSVLVLAAGTSDMPAAEEAALTARMLGCRVRTIYDIGVAGLHRLIAQLPAMRKASVIIAVAGMEGALPSVVAGLVACPVIGVPTSVGYGTSLKGMTALLAMLNSCASGLTVVNIDNGFGAGFAAAQMLRMAQGRRPQHVGSAKRRAPKA